MRNRGLFFEALEAYPESQGQTPSEVWPITDRSTQMEVGIVLMRRVSNLSKPMVQPPQEAPIS